MAYRRTDRYQRRILAMREGKARARIERAEEAGPVPRWAPPDLRRRLIVEDYDSGAVRRTVFDLHATPRIDCYRVVIDGKPQAGRFGFSRVLELLRLAMPRKCSLRWVAG